MIVTGIIGALVIVATTFFISLGPLSPVLGGGVAGYLEGEGGVTVGGLSGVLASLPYLLLIPFGGLGYAIVPEPLVLGLSLLAAGVLFLIGLLLTAVLGAVGGYLGVYVRSELVEEPSLVPR